MIKARKLLKRFQKEIYTEQRILSTDYSDFHRWKNLSTDYTDLHRWKNTDLHRWKIFVHRLRRLTQINFNVRNWRKRLRKIFCTYLFLLPFRAGGNYYPLFYFYSPLGVGGNYCPQITQIYTDYFLWKKLKEEIEE